MKRLIIMDVPTYARYLGAAFLLGATACLVLLSTIKP